MEEATTTQRKRFRKNIFVTQTSQDDFSDYANIPVVKATADRLLQTGQNTLQHTLLLRKEIEAEEVQNQLVAKRSEFAAKIAGCANRHHDLLVRQQILRNRTKEAGSIIAEQNVKQRRALKRCESDAEERMKLEDDLIRLTDIANAENFKCYQLRKEIGRYQKSADFLHEVVSSLPPDYLTTTDDPVKALIERHGHLASTKEHLTSHVLGIADELKSATDNLRLSEINHGYDLLEMNGMLERYRTKFDGLKAKNESLEAEAGWAHQSYKEQIISEGNVLRAVDGLVERCGGMNMVLSRGKERMQELASRRAEKNLEKNRMSKSQQSTRESKSQSSLEKSGLDVILSGISVQTQRRKEVAAEAIKRLRAREHKTITFS